MAIADQGDYTKGGSLTRIPAIMFGKVRGFGLIVYEAVRSLGRLRTGFPVLELIEQ